MQQKDKAGIPETVDRAIVEESAQDLYENAPCGYLSTLSDGTIIRVNKTFLDWTGYKRDELVGRKRLSDLLTIGGRMYYETHYAPLLQMQGGVREIAVDVMCTDRSVLPVLVTATAVQQDDSGKPALFRTTIFSARDRREYERELLRARERAEDSENRARLLAQTLQESLIPPAPPQIPGLDVAGVYRPAGHGDEVGGDFYDVFETSGGDWAVILGDVAGKGAAAAGITALARYTVRAAAIRTKEPKQVLETLNRALLHQKAGRFCTALYCTIHQKAESRFGISLAVGGHPLPIFVPRKGDPTYVGQSGTLLGVFDDPEVEDLSIELATGDGLFFYTDGVLEARRESEFYGEERLTQSLAGRRGETAGQIATGLATEVVDFQNGFARDDIAIVVLKVP